MARGDLTGVASIELETIPPDQLVVLVEEVLPGSWVVVVEVGEVSSSQVLGRAIELLSEARDAASARGELSQPPPAIQPVPVFRTSARGPAPTGVGRAVRPVSQHRCNGC